MNIGEWILALFGGSMAKLVFASIFSAGMVVTLFKLFSDSISSNFDAQLLSNCTHLLYSDTHNSFLPNF